MGILSSFFDVVAGVSILAGRSSLLDTSLTTIAGRNLTVRGALGLSFLSIGFINLVATSRKQKKIERLSKEAESEPQLFLVTYHVYDKDTGRLTYEDAVQITSKDENTAKGDALVMLEEGGLDDEEYEIFNVRPISQDYQKQLYGAENGDAEGRFYDELEKEIEAKEREIRDFKEYLDKVGYGRQEIMELNSMEQELAELEQMEFKDAESFGAEREIHQLITFGGNGEASTLVFQNPDDIKDYLYYGLYGFENLMDEKWYIDDDSAEELNKKNFDKKTKNMSIDEVIRYLHFTEVYYLKTLVDLDKDFIVDGEDGGIVQASFKGDRTGFGAEYEVSIERNMIQNLDGVEIEADSQKELKEKAKEIGYERSDDFVNTKVVGGLDGYSIAHQELVRDAESFDAETFSAHFRIPKSDLRLIPNPDGSGGFIVDIDIDSMREIEKERKERQRIQRNKRAKERREMKKYLRSQGLTEEEIRDYMKDLARERRYRVAETFSAEKEVYVLTFSDPMRKGKLVELPFLTYEEAQEYIEANIAPYNANKPFSQQIATRIIFPSEEYNAPAAVMRTYKGRKSPSISAKSVKVGTRKRGNDGKMWQVRSVKSRGKRTQRWFKD